jgi:CHASE3 domain sensor protein
MGRKFKRFLFASYAAAFLLFFGLQYFMKSALTDVAGYTAALSHDHEVMMSMQQVLMSLQQAESNRRGYILTKNLDFIRDYNAAVKSVQESFTYLKQLNTNRGYRDEFLDSLGVSINSRIGLIQSSIELAMTNKTSDSVQILLTGQGKALMESIRPTILQLMTERRNSRDDNYRALTDVNAEISFLYSSALVAIVVFSCGLTAATYYYFKKLSSVEEGLRWELFQARQQVQHATSRYQDLRTEMKNQSRPGDGGEQENI